MWMKRPWRCLCLQPPFEDWSSAGKEFTCNAGNPGLIPGSARSAGEGIGYPLQYSWASLVAQLVKNLPAIRETWVRSLGWEDPLERERLPTPVFWPGEFHGLYSPWGHKDSDMTATFTFHTTITCKDPYELILDYLLNFIPYLPSLWWSYSPVHQTSFIAGPFWQ